MPDQSFPQKLISHLGKPIRIYPGRRMGRVFLLFLAGLLTLVGLGILFYALWRVGQHLKDFGPVVAGQSFFWPGVTAVSALLFAVVFFLSAIRKTSKSLAIFQNGFALQERAVSQAWRWEDGLAVTSKVTRTYVVGIYSGTRHHYTLKRADSAVAVLDDSFQLVDQAVRFIQQETFQMRFERVVQQIEAGKSVAFGLFLLASEGFRYGEQAFRWSELQGVEMLNGKLYISGKTRFSLPVDEIPNLDVLVTILLQNVNS